MAPFTKEMLLQDFAAGVEDFDAFFGCVLGRSAVGMATGTETDSAVATSDAALKLPGAKLVSDAYDFAFEGRLRPGTFREESEEMEGLLNLFNGLRQAVSERSSADGFKLCVRTMDMAHSRRLLEGSINFTSKGVLFHHVRLTELADLAGIDEKTLRNMASPKHPARIKTEKIDGRAYVHLSVAMPWLVARGFKPTVYEDFRPERNFVGDAFFSVLDLAEYIEQGEKRMALSRDDLVKRLGDPGDAERLKRIEQGYAPLDEDFLGRLARVLELRDPEAFVKSALDLQDTPYGISSDAIGGEGEAQ